MIELPDIPALDPLQRGDVLLALEHLVETRRCPACEPVHQKPYFQDGVERRRALCQQHRLQQDLVWNLNTMQLLCPAGLDQGYPNPYCSQTLDDLSLEQSLRQARDLHYGPGRTAYHQVHKRSSDVE